MKMAKKVGQKLKEARKFKGFTQKDVANIMHMTQQQYSRYETGIFELNYELIVQFCKLYDITPNDLFDIN